MTEQAYALHEERRLERPDEIVVRPRAQRRDLVANRLPTRDHHEQHAARRRRSMQQREKVRPRHIRQIEVGDDEIRYALRDDRRGRLRGPRDRDKARRA